MCLEKITFCFAECAAPKGPCAEQNSRKQPRIGPQAFSWLFPHVSPVDKGMAFVDGLKAGLSSGLFAVIY